MGDTFFTAEDLERIMARVTELTAQGRPGDADSILQEWDLLEFVAGSI